MTKKTTDYAKRSEYTEYMTFATVATAPKPRTESAKIAAWIYAAVLVVMAVGQLFSFEKFIPLIEDYWLPGGHGTATLVAGLIAVCEVVALPFLLRMPLSPLMRWLSLACGIVVAITWTVLGIVAVASDGSMANSGILGTKVAVPFGWAQLVWALMLAVLAAWSVWGLWPTRKK